MATSTSKVAVNNDSHFNEDSLHNQITTNLIANGSIPAIQTSLLTELQASGWTTNLREYITQLMRSGECTKYDDLMDRVLQEVMKSLNSDKKANGVNGKAGAGSNVNLKIPESAIKEGVKTVKKELGKFCNLED